MLKIIVQAKVAGETKNRAVPSP